MDFVKVAAYPEERPSILCYTIKPEKSGTYIVTVYDGETSSTSTAEDSDLDTSSVLFIYKEHRNEDGETGYYSNFMFKDDDGNVTDSLSINYIIYLRQLFLQANPNYFEAVYSQSLPDDETGGGAFKCSEGNGDYARAMY